MTLLDCGIRVLSLARGAATRWFAEARAAAARKIGDSERQACVRVADASERSEARIALRPHVGFWGLGLACLVLASCDDSGMSGEGGPLPIDAGGQYTVGGTVSGLTGSVLVLQINGAGNLNVIKSGTFAFGTPLGTGTTYSVTVATQPSKPAQTCVVSNGSGTVSTGNVTNVSIVCTPKTATFTIGGTVSGLTGSGLVLQNNGGDNLSVTANGAFTFLTPVASGTAYTVTVETQPGVPNQSCVVTSGTGTVASAAIGNVVVVCRAIGQFAYTANSVSRSISGYTIDPATGALTQIPGSPLTVGTAPATVTLSPNGKFAYVATTSGKQIYGYTINPASGALAPIPGSPFAVPFTLGQQFPGAVVDPQSKFLYLPSLSDGEIAGFTIDAVSGALTIIPGSPIVSGAGASGLPAFSPNGKFLYVTNQTGASVSGYSIDPATGVLTAVAGSPFATGTNPTWINFTPNGNFAYVSNSGSNNVSAYAVNTATGTLTPVTGSPFPADVGPADSTIDSSGAHLYQVNRTASDVSVYNINPLNGALTAVTGSPFSTGPGPYLLNIEASGRFAYVASSRGGDVHGYSIDPTTGALAPLPGSPYAAGTAPQFIIIDPSGKFAYAANNQSNNISAYTIDSTTGALMTVAGSPFATGLAPFVVSISPEAPGIRD